MSRDKILTKIREQIAKREKVPLPSYTNYIPITFDDKIKKFTEVLGAVGGKAITTKKEDISKKFTELFPEKTTKVLSESELIKGDKFENLEKSKDALDYNVAVLNTKLAVAENGSFYLEQKNLTQRSALFLVENIVIIINKEDIVNNMNEAYKKIKKASSYGVFISGPSKTADIEQCLVFGASGAINLYVLLY